MILKFAIINIRQMKRINYLISATVLWVLTAYTTFSQHTTEIEWKYNNGWALQKAPLNNTFEKFFAIGTWHVPGYIFSDSIETEQRYENRASLFRERAAPFNMVFVTPGQQKKYMSDKIHILNPFSAVLHSFIDKTPDLPKGKDKDYYRSQYMKKAVNSPEFEKHLDFEIKQILKKMPNEKHIYSHIDEIALGGVSKWAIPPSVGAKINERLKQFDKNALVFVDLLGHSKGSTYLFEQRYLQNHGSLPAAPPYELIESKARDIEIPLLGFSQAYNGLPVYQFNNGKYSYTDYDAQTLKSIWYENTKLIAAGYKGSGDVFGINAFRDFFAYPELAGITVDALKEGLGSKTPIWLYFDGNGYAKPAGLSPTAYVDNVKCQIYTSVIHGATGILFWNDWNKKPEVFDVLLPMLEELNKNLHIIKLKTVDKKVDGDLHIMIQENANGEKYIIATNTSKTAEIKLGIANAQKKMLKPLEVYISKI